MIPVSTTISKNGYATPLQNQIFGEFDKAHGLGDILGGLMNDQRMDKNDGGLTGMELIGSVYQIADQNAPCVLPDDNMGAMVKTRTKNVDNVLDGDSMIAQPNPASNLQIFGLSHLKCDMENAGGKVLRHANNFNPMLKSPFN